jgi:ubiquinone/menaquinone biosynthesis C-methylase UbiE
VDAADWDARYAGTDLVWGTEPNRWVAAALEQATPGRALDVACGEGRNAIWLAGRGWSAVGLDFSSAAVSRARQLAEQAGVAERTEFVVGDVVAGPLPDGPFDAVIVAYLHLPPVERRQALRHAAGRVAPGGLLLVVGHDSSNLTEGVGGPQDPEVLYTAQEVVEDLPPGFTVDRAERVHRPVTTPEGERVALDALVVAIRR